MRKCDGASMVRGRHAAGVGCIFVLTCCWTTTHATIVARVCVGIADGQLRICKVVFVACKRTVYRGDSKPLVHQLQDHWPSPHLTTRLHPPDDCARRCFFLYAQHVLGYVELHSWRRRGHVVRGADEDGAEHELQLHRVRHRADGTHPSPLVFPDHHGQGVVEADGPEEQVFRAVLAVRQHVWRGRGEKGLHLRRNLQPDSPSVSYGRW